MSDERFRQLQRQAQAGDRHAEAQLLALRIRQGSLPEEHVLVASYLGHKASRVLFPGVSVDDLNLLPASFSGFHGRGVDYITRAATSQHIDTHTLIDFCADIVEYILPYWQKAYEEDYPITDVIEAARRRESDKEILDNLYRRLHFAEDPYNPDAMSVAECAQNLSLLLMQVAGHHRLGDQALREWAWINAVFYLINEARNIELGNAHMKRFQRNQLILRLLGGVDL